MTDDYPTADDCARKADPFLVEVQGLDWSIDLPESPGHPGGPRRLSVDAVLDCWPPRDLGLRLRQEGAEDLVAAYALVGHGIAEDVEAHDENQALHTRVKDLEEIIDSQKRAYRDLVRRTKVNNGQQVDAGELIASVAQLVVAINENLDAQVANADSELKWHRLVSANLIVLNVLVICNFALVVITWILIVRTAP